MNPPISYYGGKQRLAKRIVDLFPAHDTYVEPFCGGVAVFFAKEPAHVEVINDIDHKILNFYRVLREQPEELINLLNVTPYHEEEYRLCKERWRTGRPYEGLKDAASYFILTQYAFAKKINGGFGFSARQCQGRLTYNRINRVLAPAAERLRKTTLMCRDAIDVIKRFDRKNTLFYCDPPYVGTDQGHYQGYTGKEFHELIETLQGVKGKVVLSHYESCQVPLDWHVVKIPTSCTVAASPNRSPRIEYLYIRGFDPEAMERPKK